MENTIPPVLLIFMLVLQLVHSFLRNRLAQILLQIVIIHNTCNLLVFPSKLLRSRAKPKIRIILYMLWQITLKLLHFLCHF